MITTAEGALLTVRVPSAGSAPVRIEISTGPPPRAHKSGQ
jgi:hypothetical protein